MVIKVCAVTDGVNYGLGQEPIEWSRRGTVVFELRDAVLEIVVVVARGHHDLGRDAIVTVDELGSLVQISRSRVIGLANDLREMPLGVVLSFSGPRARDRTRSAGVRCVVRHLTALYLSDKPIDFIAPDLVEGACRGTVPMVDGLSFDVAELVDGVRIQIGVNGDDLAREDQRRINVIKGLGEIALRASIADGLALLGIHEVRGPCGGPDRDRPERVGGSRRMPCAV